MIYLDSAATSFHKPPCVAEAVFKAMGQMGNSGRGGHPISLETGRVIYGARKKLAALFGVPDPSRVIFTANSTQSLNMAISGLFHPGDHVITTVLEHNSVLRPLFRLEDQGMALTILPCDQKGRLDPRQLEQALRPETKGVVCTHASNLTGNMVDIPQVGRFCRDHHLLLVVDASQTAGAFPIRMEEMGIHVLCFTGHKSLLGPQGTGGLCLAPGVELPSFCVGGSGIHSYSRTQPDQLPERLEAGTLNGHGIAGLSAALDWLAETGIEKIGLREQQLARRFYQQVKEVPDVKIYGDLEQHTRAPIVALNIGDNDSQEVCDHLAQRYGIAVRGGAHCAPLMHKALGTQEQGAVRFSFCWFNTEDEVDQAARAVAETAEEWT